MSAKIDEMTQLRTGLSYTPEKPEFSPAVGGYNRNEVNKYVEEQAADAEAMRRVFYEKTQEQRDELALLSEENRRLRVALDEITPLSATLGTETAGNGGSADGVAEDNRKLVEQVAGILKARHEAELSMRDERVKAAGKALEDARAESMRLTVLIEGREAQIASLNRALAELEEQRAAQGGNDEILTVLAQKEAELGALQGDYAVALLERDAALMQAQNARGDASAEIIAQLETLQNDYAVALLERDAALMQAQNARAEALAEREAALMQAQNAYQAALAEKEAAMEARENDYARAISERDAALAEKEATNWTLQNEHTVALAQRDAALIKAQNAYQAALDEKEAQYETLRNEHAVALLERDAALSRAQNARAVLAEKEAALETLENEHTIALLERDAALAQEQQTRAAALDEKEAALVQAHCAGEALLAGKDAELETLRRENAQSREKLATYALALAGNDARAAELSAALAAKKEEALILSETVEKKNAVIEAFNSELSDMRGDMREARAAAQKASERIGMLEAEIAVRCSAPGPEAFAQKESEAEALRERLSHREDELRHNEAETARLSAALSQRENEAKRSEAENVRLNAVLAQREEEYTRLRGAIEDIVRIRTQLDMPAAGEQPDAATPKEKDSLRIIAPNFSNVTR